MRNTCQPGSTLQEFRNGKDIGRRNSVHSTYGLMNNEHFFWGGFLYNFFCFCFFAIITFDLCRPPKHARRRQIPNCVLCFAFGRFWVVDLMLAGSIAGIDEVDRYISSSISPHSSSDPRQQMPCDSDGYACSVRKLPSLWGLGDLNDQGFWFKNCRTPFNSTSLNSDPIGGRSLRTTVCLIPK